MDGYYSAKTIWILGSSFFCWGWNFLTDQYMDLVGRMDCGSQQNPTASCSFCFLVFFVNANGILWLRGMGWCILFHPICDWLVRCRCLHTGICCTELVYDTKRESTVDSPYGNHKLHDFHLFPLGWPYFYSWFGIVFSYDDSSILQKIFFEKNSFQFLK